MAEKRQWVSPVIREYGTFEAATQDKCFGTSDGFTFMGDAITNCPVTAS